jgi:hypothetical protein
VNFPSTFDVPPLASTSCTEFGWTINGWPYRHYRSAMAITISAIYEVKATPEAAKGKVWIGRLLSSDYHFHPQTLVNRGCFQLL